MNLSCIDLRKKIKAYLDDELSDSELNDFLRHLKGCHSCMEETEISFIVQEGVRLLDENSSYSNNLKSAFNTQLMHSSGFIRHRKHLIRFRYVMDTLLFWMLISVVFVFFRAMDFI